MKLTDLEPRFLSYEGDPKEWRYATPRADANGITFVCPKCFEANGMKRPGVHSVICWDPSVPQSVSPGPGRWEFVGVSFDDLTLRAGSSSVKLEGGCDAHFFITNGEVTFA